MQLARIHVSLGNLARAAILPTALFAGFSLQAAPPTISLVNVTGTTFNAPIGIDYHEPTDSVVMSVNYPTGGPNSFERILNDASYVPFSAVTGLTDEVKIATVRSGNVGGFVTGSLFTGNGVDGQVVKISPDGSTVVNPWADLPGTGNGLMRGSLYVDRGGAWGGDLVVVTSTGELWRVNSSGTPTTSTPLASVGVHLEGLITLPNNLAKYGPLSGKAIAGAEDQGRLYIFDTDGSFTYRDDLGINIEDIDVIDGGNFYGVAYAESRLLGAPASTFAGMEDDILLTQEIHPGASGLYHLWWDGSSLQTEQFTLTGDITSVFQWEHVTFANAGILEIPDAGVPEASTVIGAVSLTGLLGATCLRRRRARTVQA